MPATSRTTTAGSVPAAITTTWRPLLWAVPVAASASLWLLDAPAQLGLVGLHAITPLLVLLAGWWTARGGRWRADLVGAGLLTAVGAPAAATVGVATAGGLLAAATLEEVAYRAALPAAVGLLAGRWLGHRWAVATAVAISAAAFVGLPGHLAQAGGYPLAVGGFVAVHLVLLWLVWRVGLLLTAAACHFALNAWLIAGLVDPAAVGPATGMLVRGGVLAVALAWAAAVDRRTTHREEQGPHPQMGGNPVELRHLRS